MSQDLAVQSTLNAEIFDRFINLTVGLSLGGSASFSLEELQKVLDGEPLGRGTELIVTARYYVKDVRMPVKRETDYSVPYEQRSREEAYLYKLGGAKLDLGLIGVDKIEGKAGRLSQAIAAPCSCLVAIEPNVKKPEGYGTADFPLKGYWAKAGCPECHGKGYVQQKKNKAPLAGREWSQGPIVLVDDLPDPPEIPEGYCQECGQAGESSWNHHQDCPVGKKLVAEERKEQEQYEPPTAADPDDPEDSE